MSRQPLSLKPKGSGTAYASPTDVALAPPADDAAPLAAAAAPAAVAADHAAAAAPVSGNHTAASATAPPRF